MSTFDFTSSPIDPGLSVIEASAGTGKTFSISLLVPRLLLEGTIERLDHALIVTFTNDAAGELADRIRRVLVLMARRNPENEEHTDPGVFALRQKFGDAAVRATGEKALMHLDRLSVSTIHAFCQKVLQSEGPLCGYPVPPELVVDASDWVREWVYEEWIETIAKDAALASLASQMGWNVAADTKFVSGGLSLVNPEYCPKANGVDSVRKELESALNDLNEESVKQFLEILGDFEKFSQSAPGLAVEIPGLLNELVSLSLSSIGDKIGLLHAFSNPAGWINKGSKVGKQVAAGLQLSDFTLAAGRVLSQIYRLHWNLRVSMLERVRSRMLEKMVRDRTITYDGIIQTVCKALHGPASSKLIERLRERYKVALIDESQDTDPTQYSVFAKIFLGVETHRMVLIGDPKQAIYGFRGADVNTYLSARNAAQTIFQLTRTYRAPEPLVQAVNALFVPEGSFLKEGLSFTPASSGLEGDWYLKEENDDQSPSRVEFWIAPEQDQETLYRTSDHRLATVAERVAGKVLNLINQNTLLLRTRVGFAEESCRVCPRHIAILVSTHEEGGYVDAALRQYGIPRIRADLADILTTEEANDLLKVLQAIHEPRSRKMRLAAMTTRLLARTDQEIRGLEEDSVQRDQWQDRLFQLRSVWEQKGVAATLSRLAAEEGLLSNLASLENGERRIVNWRQLIDLLQVTAQELGNRPQRLIHWLSGEIRDATERSSVEERQVHLESDQEAVQIVTMHSAKGLEYRLVFCPFLWSSHGANVSGVCKFNRPGEAPLYINTDLDQSRNAEIYQRQFEDRIRLAYVAITRAQVKVWIYGGIDGGSRSKVKPSALDWLLRDPTVEGNFSDWSTSVGSQRRLVRHRASLESLSARGDANELIRIISPPLAPDPQISRYYAKVPGEDIQLTAEEPVNIAAPWGNSSFSALTREDHPHGSSGAAEEKVVTFEYEESAPPNPFFDAPGGTRVGNAVHDWIEQWDFSEVDSAELQKHLQRYPLVGKDPAQVQSFPSKVESMLNELREVQLPGVDEPLHRICPAAEASEWAFQLPVGKWVGGNDFAAVFARHGEEAYAATLRELPSEQMRGYFRGFVDRLFVYKGKYGVIDWKTNNLGPSLSDYSTGNLISAAAQSHYNLQSILYQIALRRYLGKDVPLLGGFVVYLRGISQGSDRGVIHYSPNPDLLADLDGLFAFLET